MPSRDFWIALCSGSIMTSAARDVSEWCGYHGAALGVPWWISVIVPITLGGLWIAATHWFAQQMR